MSVSRIQETLSVRIFKAFITEQRRVVSCSLPAFVSCMWGSSVFLALSLLTVQVEAQVDSQQVTTQADSQKVTIQADSLLKKNGIKKDTLVNIVPGNKKIRAYGWGEYRVGGKCLCCDNTNDGDCIVVHNIERTERVRISQIVDGKIEGDTSDNTTYFGNLNKREHLEPVNFLMVDISLGKMYEVRKVFVYTIMNKEKHTNFLSNCELGYYDQFDRLQWTGTVESTKYNEPIIFEMQNPVLTKAIMLRVKGGKSRITEAAIFCENKASEKP